eukprot:4457420-Pleurochrysis_carterae.AAC.1
MGWRCLLLLLVVALTASDWGLTTDRQRHSERGSDRVTPLSIIYGIVTKTIFTNPFWTRLKFSAKAPSLFEGANAGKIENLVLAHF